MIFETKLKSGAYWPWRSAVELRQKIIDSTKDDESFHAFIRRVKYLPVGDLLIEQLTSIGESFQKKGMAVEGGNGRLEFRAQMIHDAVCYTTGPGVVCDFIIGFSCISSPNRP